METRCWGRTKVLVDLGFSLIKAFCFHSDMKFCKLDTWAPLCLLLLVVLLLYHDPFLLLWWPQEPAQVGIKYIQLHTDSTAYVVFMSKRAQNGIRMTSFSSQIKVQFVSYGHNLIFVDLANSSAYLLVIAETKDWWFTCGQNNRFHDDVNDTSVRLLL